MSLLPVILAVLYLLFLVNWCSSDTGYQARVDHNFAEHQQYDHQQEDEAAELQASYDDGLQE